MPSNRAKIWTALAVNGIIYSLFASGCSLIPASGIGEGATPTPNLTTKSNPNRPDANPGAAIIGGSQPELLEPNTLVHFSITFLNSESTPISGNAVVGPDGTVVIGGFGTVKVGGLTTKQATVVLEGVISQYNKQPNVKLTIAGPIQPVQAFGDWTPVQNKSNNNPAPNSDGWQTPVSGSGLVVIPNYATPSGNSLAPTPNPSPELPNNSNWQLQPGGTVPRVQPSQEETGPTPKTLNNNNSDNARVLGPNVHPYSQVAVYPQVPTEVKPVTMPTYVVGPPDILQIDSVQGLITQPVRGPHLIRPDGTIGVGIYGSVYVAGMTLEQAKEAIARVIHARLDPAKKKYKDVLDDLSVDVLAYNSKVYYVITDRVGFGEIVARFPITGYETVLDAISQLSGLPPEAARRHIWVARRCPDGKNDNILPVDWIGISQKGLTATNYQLLPGDRVYVQADRLITFNYVLSKFLAPIERVFGLSLLASQTVNSIRSGTAP